MSSTDSQTRDAVLVAAIAAGDKPALAELYDRYAPSLLGFGLRIMGERRESEDLLHDVFIEVWQKAADYDTVRGSVRAWLFLRMRSRAFDRRKSAAFSRVDSLDTKVAALDRLDQAQGMDRGQAEDPLCGPDRTRVRLALDTLRDEQRLVLQLGYFEGMSSTEIANQLQIPVGTVKSRVAAALDRLRFALGAHTIASPSVVTR